MHVHSSTIYGPILILSQSERLDTYHKYADDLIRRNKAYRCFCTPEELDAIKQNAMEQADNGNANYSGKCRHINAAASLQRAKNGEKHCVRFSVDHKRPMPSFNDLVYRRYRRNVVEDDFILLKRDGFPTYHFANVVDDILMKITHVIRGAVSDKRYLQFMGCR